MTDSENRILAADQIEVLRLLEDGPSPGEIEDVFDSHEALRAALATAEAERDAAAELSGQVQEWYTAYRRKSEARVTALTEALRALVDAHPLTDGAAITAARALLMGEPE